MKPCSMCGNKPAVCVDRMHKGTYWLCGDCAGERIEELIHLRARIEVLEKKYWRYRLYIQGQVGKTIDEDAALAAEEEK